MLHSAKPLLNGVTHCQPCHACNRATTHLLMKAVTFFYALFCGLVFLRSPTSRFKSNFWLAQTSSMLPLPARPSYQVKLKSRLLCVVKGTAHTRTFKSEYRCAVVRLFRVWVSEACDSTSPQVSGELLLN